jgi:hypothetical protein
MKKHIILFCLLAIGLITAKAQTIQGTYAIKNVQTGMLLRIKDANTKDGTPLVSYDPEDWKCMTWDFKQVDANTYQLKNLLSGKTFEPAGAITAGTALHEEPLSTTATTQLYEFEQVAKDTYTIKLKGTDLYVTPSDEKGRTNSSIILSPKSGSKLQQWTIYQQSPTI